LTDASRHILPKPEPTNQETLETKTAWTAWILARSEQRDDFQTFPVTMQSYPKLIFKTIFCVLLWTCHYTCIIHLYTKPNISIFHIIYWECSWTAQVTVHKAYSTSSTK
jgi:hypothetical protein